MNQIKSESLDEENEGEISKRSITKQICLGLLTNFSSIAPSMSLGFSAVALPILTNPHSSLHLTTSQASWFASIASLATPVGCVLSGPIADRLGRKSALYVVNLSCFLGWITIAIAHYHPNLLYEILLGGRILTGLSTGLSSIPATIYMAEIASLKLRGVFCTWSSISFSIGVLVVYTLGFLLKDSWEVVALITATLPIIGMIFSIFLVPESPSWLISKNRMEEAKKNMCKIFGTKTYSPLVAQEINKLIQNKTPTKPKKNIPQQVLKKIKHLCKKTCLKPFFLILTYFFFQQFGGTFSIVFYAINIVEGAGIQLNPYLTIVLIGLVRLFAAMLLSYICKIFGRRPLSIFSGVGMTLTMFLLGLYSLFSHQNKIQSPIIPLCLLFTYFFTSTLGFLPLPFAMTAEVFPRKIRGVASGLTVALAYFFNFITVKIYPNMVEGWGMDGVFFFYGGMALIGTIFVGFLLPETKGKSLEEIQEYFSGGQEGGRRRTSLLRPGGNS